MLYLIYGDDTRVIFGKSQFLIEGLLKKKPDAEVVRVTVENFDAEHIKSLAGTQGLFERKIIAVLDRINEELAVIDSIPAFSASDNIFIVLAEKVGAKELKYFIEHAEKIIPCVLKKNEGEAFNMFALTDAFGCRDKKKLWVLFEKAKRSGASAEEIHGILFWQAKSLALAAQGKDAESVGMKTFPFSKARGFLKNFSPEEITAFPGKLATLYHESRRGGINLEGALERFILTL